MRSIEVHRNKGTDCDGVSCNRLIQNNITCWNYLYLARRFEKASDEETRKNLLRAAAVHTPIAWGSNTGQFQKSPGHVQGLPIASDRAMCLKHPPKQGETICKKIRISNYYENSYGIFCTFVGTNPIRPIKVFLPRRCFFLDCGYNCGYESHRTTVVSLVYNSDL